MAIDRKFLDDWWKKALEKERTRMTNAPKSHKGDKTSVPLNFSHFAPPVPKKNRNAWSWKKVES